MSNQEKVWANGAFGIKRTFESGGYIHQLDLKWEDFVAWGNQYVNEKGYVKLDISGSREPRMDDYGNEKMNISLNTYKPKNQQQNVAQHQNQQQTTSQAVASTQQHRYQPEDRPPVQNNSGIDDGIPF